MPWGFIPPAATLDHIPNCPGCASGVAMHPSFLYEIAFFLLLFAVLQWLRPRLQHIPGELFKVFLASYIGFRFGVEFVRGNPEVALGLTRGQWFLLATAPLITWYFVRQIRSGVYRTASSEPSQHLIPSTRDGEPDD